MEHTTRGRWGGAITSKPLPLEDPAIELLSARERERLTATWQLRAAYERRVADSFEVIRDALIRRGAPDALVQLAVRAIDDEYRHTELSRVVASRFAGRELPQPERLPLEIPRHEGASDALRDTLFVIGQCVLNETTASAFLETSLALARGELARAALRELLSDEIDHGRLGWAYLSWLDADARREVEPWLLPMTFLNLRIWKQETPHDPKHTEVLTHHGSPPSSVLHEALVDAVRDLIVPGLEQLGLSTGPIRAWLDAGAFTDRPPREFAR